MKLILFVLLLSVTMLANPIRAETFYWRDADGKKAPDTASMKSKDGFGGHFILTANEQIYSDWAKPTPPTINITSTIPVGKFLVPVVIFVNPMKRPDGTVDVTYDLEIFKPDGSLARKIPNLVSADGVFNSPQFHLQLSRSGGKWFAEKGDPLGKWTFKIQLRDNVRGVALPLEASIEITEASPSLSSDQ